MSHLSYRPRRALAAMAGCLLVVAGTTWAQELAPGSGVKFQVRGPAERLEMTVNTSKVVEFPFDVPRMLVNNPDVVRVIPISSKSVQLSALKAGVTQLNVWDTQDHVTTLDVIVLGDVAELDLALKTLFPQASLRLRPLNSSLYISGFVPKAEMVASITRVAQDYFPNIINDMTVGGVHKILLHVKVMEISRTKLRSLGFDWAQLSAGDSFVTQSVSTLLQTPGTLTGNTGATVRFGVVDSGGQFYGFIEALRQNNLARLLAEPTLVTLDGRPATFNVGGQVPIPVQQALGVTTVTYRQFGTQIDFVPIVLGNGMIRLEVRPDITEIDPSLRDTVTGVPGFRQRTADTAVEMKAGQTLAIAGLVFTREDAVNRGIPWLADLPWAGAAFRRVSNQRNDVELLIFVTPEFCEALEPEEVPPCGPGQLTTSPTDVELYGRGYLEVPNNCPPGHRSTAPGYEELPANPTTAPSNGASWQSTSRERSGAAASRRGGAPVPVSAVPARPASLRRPGIPSQGGDSANLIPEVVSPASQPASLLGPQGYDELK